MKLIEAKKEQVRLAQENLRKTKEKIEMLKKEKEKEKEKDKEKDKKKEVVKDGKEKEKE